MNSLTLLVIADPHYVHNAAEERENPKWPGAYGAEWTLRAIREARRVRRPDGIILLGDVVAAGSAPGGEQDIIEFATAVREADLPVIVVPGNHDGDPDRLLRIFGDTPGLHRINGYDLYSFVDDRTAKDVTTRRPEVIARFLKECSDDPVITIQHNPIYPPLDCSKWPYMPTNADEIIAAYDRAKVILSLSGHYHPGSGPADRNGAVYLTCAALTGAPFPFYVVSLRGRSMAVERMELRMPPKTGLLDSHVHTHFGYCYHVQDVHPLRASERAAHLGLKGIACTEHAGNLYLSRDEYYGRLHVDRPDVVRAARESGRDRVEQYRSEMAKYRSEFIRVGLEAECDHDGNLDLLEEDRDGWDLLLGAVHWAPSHLDAATPREAKRVFMWLVERLLAHDIDVLAHPFRFLQSAGVARPTELYRPLAKLLAERNVAAELNFNFHEPDPEFYRICVEQGARIVLGSDAHALANVGDLHPHLRLLKQIGVPVDSIAAPR